ncbi:30S ribosomal protein S3 [Patescibacteria group bacterium]|nr:30S ribosomal protein S3 [Patescibacteria group bacterium]
MGNKISATGFRIGTTIDWRSKWFSEKKDFSNYLLEDFKIRNFIEKNLSNTGVENIIIERNLNDITVTLSVARPGMVIGRQGSGINILKQDLTKIIEGKKISINVEEVKKAESSAKIIASNICSQIEKRIHYKKAVLSAIARAKDQGVMGIKIVAGGVLGGANSISRTETYKDGMLPQSTIKQNIEYAKKQAHPSYGVIGIRVWVCKNLV